jgi:ribosomal-protein-alanine N-acetyltransferase
MRLNFCPPRPDFGTSPSGIGNQKMLQPPDPFRLRPLSLSDLPALSSIEQKSFPTPTKEKVYRYELTENKLAHYQALTLQHENQVERLVGFAGFWIIADELHISTIAVDPPQRGLGLGELLLLNILTLAYEHAAALVTLEVRESNQIAQALYQKYAFEFVGRRLRYYRDTGEDALLMTVNLKSNQQYPNFLQGKEKSLYSRLISTPI